MSGINASSLSFYYQDKKIIDNVNTTIPSQAITCLVGPNGSGKSTLLKLFAGLLPPANGAVTLDQKILQKYPRKELAKKLAYFPQQARFPASLTVKEYVALARYCHQSWFAKLNSHDLFAIDRAITLTNLNELADQPIGKLSVGQQQRVRIALLLAQESEYLLLDEPMAGLDIKQQADMLNLLQYLQRQLNKTIVVILHDLHQVKELADHVHFLKRGCTIAMGHPKDVLTSQLLYEVFDYQV